MGTRGLMGFAVDGEVKATYNHFDSYPSGLGQDMLNWLRSLVSDGVERLAADQVRDLVLVDEQDIPSAEDFFRLGSSWQNVSTGADWYSLLRGNQGNPAETLRSGVMTDGLAFAADSLFCEWGYVVDFDNRVFEVYRGFVKGPHNEGRFSSMEPSGEYYPIRLVSSYGFDDLPENLDALENGDE